VIPIANPDLGTPEAESASEVIHSGMVADGEHVRAFEDAFSEFCNTNHGVATSNGTTALHSGLKALGIGHGDKVVTTPFSFVSSANAIRLTGAKPVFADIDPQTYNLDPESVADVVARQDIDAILTVHLYGLPSDLDALREIADDHDLSLIEDCAQAHGATYDGHPVGSVGDIGCFSFYPTKNMTTGEGGMVVTDRKDIAEAARSYGNHGRPPDGGYEHVRLGNNFRMTNIAAAIGQEQLKKLPDFLADRRANAQRFDTEIHSDIVSLPSVPKKCEHAYHQYTVRTDTRETFLDYLHEQGVGAKIYYPKCIHQQPAYDTESYEYSCPIAERVAEEVVSIPVHPQLSEENISTIIDTVNTFYHGD
jgi:dTDP-4-amino-4,6-dideoxygalactose transaminase